MTKISPWLSVTDAGAAVRFYEAGLGAVESEADRFEDGGKDGNIQTGWAWYTGI